ncbi:MAG: hypothetical protein SPH31_07610 [Arcanobacterium sp.]|nr:hypothetical protein [Arcanobacterium sp.]
MEASAEALAQIFVVFTRKNASAFLQLGFLDMEGSAVKFCILIEFSEGALVA